jgi:hypothetical protein
MRKSLIEMGLNLPDLTSVHDTFHGVIPGQSSTPIGHIDLKSREMLTFKVTSFDIGYNCILMWSFLLKFMAIIHTAYATMKMPGPKGVITIKADQRDALACQNASLLHTQCFDDKMTQEQSAKAAKTQGVRSNHRRSSCRSTIPFELHQQRKALTWPQHLLISLLISQQTTRRRGP